MDKFDIDAVILWVDGSDPVLKSKRSEYDSSVSHSEDIAGDVRFSSCGEIYWCIESLNRYAPFLRKIFIITDNQNPKVTSKIPVEIVDHTVIFKDYEKYLPCFNSAAIETLMWRIPGLSEHFLALNDDFILVAPTAPEDYFDEKGNPICFAGKMSVAWANLLRRMKPRRDGHEVVTFKSSLVNSVNVYDGGKYFFYLRHTPRPLLKSFYEKFYGERPELVTRNIQYRFRDIDQYNVHLLEYLDLDRQRLLKREDAGVKDFYIMPKPKKNYVEKKLAKLDAGNYLFCCFNSLDRGSLEDVATVKEWVKRKFGQI